MKSINSKLILVILGCCAILVATAYYFIWVKPYIYTDNAYVQGDQLRLLAQETGTVKQICVENYQPIKKNQIIAILDDTDIKIDLNKAKNNLAKVVQDITQLKQKLKEQEYLVTLKRMVLQRDQEQLDTQIKLKNSGAVSKDLVKDFQQKKDVAEKELQIAQATLKSIQAILPSENINNNPQLKIAIEDVKKNWLRLQRTRILSPEDGFLFKKNIITGSYVIPGTTVAIVIPQQYYWIEANFKETQLSDIKINNRVTVKSDYYGNKIEYTGKVAEVGNVTGSASSILPAQNATGNWVKVVQRLPVKIVLKPKELKEYPLKIGLSVSVSINKNEIMTDVDADTGSRIFPAMGTKDELQPIDFTKINNEIAEIIKENKIAD